MLNEKDYMKPGKVFGNVYFVGNRPASTHLIDTGAGLIMIDPGYDKYLDSVVENMAELGFKPADVKIILHSHGHYDHAGATADLLALCDAKTYVGAADEKMVNGEEDTSLSKWPMKFFQPDGVLRDGDTVTLGNTTVLCYETPGHTDGTLSFFFDVEEGGETYRAGMFGGAGTNTLTHQYLTEHGHPFENRQKFLSSIERLLGERVELFLGNHVGNNDTAGRLDRVRAGEKKAFIDPEAWLAFLNNRKTRILEIIAEDEMNHTIETILKEKLIVIVRGVSREKLLPYAKASAEGGIRLLECTYDATGKISDEEIAGNIAALVEAVGDQMLIGAGTVLTERQVELTKKAGGKFIISPDTNPAIIQKTKELGLVSIPGALTPTEIAAAHRAGADFVKVFPVSQMGGVDYIKVVSAPLSHVKLLAVGGVGVDQMQEYFDAGACGIGMGSFLADKNLIEKGDLAEIKTRAETVVAKLK